MDLKDWKEYKKRNKIENQPRSLRCFYFISKDKFFCNDLCLSEDKFEIFLNKKKENKIIILSKKIHEYFIKNKTEITKNLISFSKNNYYFLNVHNEIIKIKVFDLLKNDFIINKEIDLKNIPKIKTLVRQSLKDLSIELSEQNENIELILKKYEDKINRIKLEKKLERRNNENNTNFIKFE